MSYVFSSESVSEGHPDKICDQISDAILDEALRQDPNSRVAAECFTTTGLVVIGGEISTQANLDIQKIARGVIREIGYTNSDYGLDADSCSILNALHEQSPDIAQGVNKGEGLDKELGAGDQGLMFGYACTQTESYMPLPISLSHELLIKLAQQRKSGAIPYLRPDAKAQLSIEYDGRTPKRVHTVVLSTQHHPEAEHAQIQEDIVEKVIKDVIPSSLLDTDTRVFVNPTGRFVIGGPHGDAGLTGRKIIVDTYGGWASHGGGAFSGKDPTKVDRSGAYMARYIAKNLVAAGVASEVEIQIAYAIGVSQPVSVHVDTRGTSSVDNDTLIGIIKENFDLTPEGIITSLDLRRPIYYPTARYGHFGRDDLDVSWEKLDKVEAIKASLPAEAVTR
jgi:S-adenosylmethionine synthetase